MIIVKSNREKDILGNKTPQQSKEWRKLSQQNCCCPRQQHLRVLPPLQLLQSWSRPGRLNTRRESLSPSSSSVVVDDQLE